MKKYHLIKVIILLLIITSCSKDKKVNSVAEESGQNKSEIKKANAFFEQAFTEALDLSPMNQTVLGIKKDYDKWDDYSDSAQYKRVDLTRKHLRYLLDSVKYHSLDSQTRLSYNLFVEISEETVDKHNFRYYDYIVNQMDGIQSEVPAFLINYHKIDSEQDAQAYISRVAKVHTLFDQVIDGLIKREEAGNILPKFLFKKVIDQSRNIIKGKPFDNSQENSPILDDFKAKIDSLKNVDPEKKKTLISQCQEQLISSVKPGYVKLIAYLNAQEKKASNDAGVWKLASGSDYYDFMLDRATTSFMSAEQIHQVGLSEVNRIHEEMKTIMTAVSFKGNLQEFFSFMKKDKRFYFPDTEEGRKSYLDSTIAIIDNMRTKLDALFITKPKANMVVKRVEPFREKSAGTAFYSEPAPNGTRPGIYYINLNDMSKRPVYEMEAIAYHEGIPGHHMQISIAQELDVPKFRKYKVFTAFAEGWGLYSEALPKEIGLYQNPYSDYGRLSMELWRACRMVVDTGIHFKQWTREQAIEYYKSNTSASDFECENMVDRHVVLPGQATAYKVGMMKIMELRADAQKKLGNKFDVREFHEVVLTNGAVPLTILSKLVKEWVEGKK